MGDRLGGGGAVSFNLLIIKHEDSFNLKGWLSGLINNMHNSLPLQGRLTRRSEWFQWP